MEKNFENFKFRDIAASAERTSELFGQVHPKILKLIRQKYFKDEKLFNYWNKTLFKLLNKPFNDNGIIVLLLYLLRRLYLLVTKL